MNYLLAMIQLNGTISTGGLHRVFLLEHNFVGRMDRC
jgi:hypothetical protein